MCAPHENDVLSNDKARYSRDSVSEMSRTRRRIVDAVNESFATDIETAIACADDVQAMYGLLGERQLVPPDPH